ncbi:YitT family protein [Agarivorans aestuarii]|uniref:YitT family protein n=1 Tax=Agarivorans aestuarii TaxID=1563703 RepID=A0ABU7G8D3_9ALTE|nr:YitT family protein [Agarivorans aestuarii]MEE1675681.1 YitT family protein [Agarivorans aestuarii]
MEQHNWLEDFLALLIGTTMVALGVFFFKETQLLTGGTAGLALLAAQFFGLSFGQLFILINLPFFILGFAKMGAAFTFRTMACVVLVSVFTDYMHLVIELAELNRIYAALSGGFLIGTGMLILIRHKGSLGGVNILALYLQKRFNIRAGHVQMALDVVIVTASYFLVPLSVLLWSIVGAFALNIVIALNHKSGRYQGLS